jgi:antirestriction protein ArdC/phage/plasmid primase-like uncharacterized protein
MPYNPTTGKDYRGGNALYLWSTGLAQHYGDSRWMTYKQALAQGAQVRKGEQGTRIEYIMLGGMEPVTDEQGKVALDANGKPTRAYVQYERPRVMPFTVFNAAQIDGLSPAATREPMAEWVRHAQAERILQASGVPILHQAGNRAYYRPATDTITLPLREQFSAADKYYATALHELGHATGHASRLDRDLAHPFGSEGYAREELRAEIASLMLGDRLSIGHEPGQHAAYVASWIKVLEDDPRELFRAATDAEKITRFVLNYALQQSLQTAPPLQAQENAPSHQAVVPVFTQADEASRRPDMTALVIPYQEKEEAKAAAKAAGFRLHWDKQLAQWSVSSNVDLSAVARWLPGNRPHQRAVSELPEDQFKQALEAQGLTIEGLPVMDGTRQRVPVQGDTRGQRSGSYIGFLDGHPAGNIQNYRTDYKENWKAEGGAKALTQADIERLTVMQVEKQATRKAQQQAMQAKTAEAVSALLRVAPFATDNHPYLQRKGVKADGLQIVPNPVAAPRASALYQIARDRAEGAQLRKMSPNIPVFIAGELLVPVYNAAGELRNVQTIGADGRKGFAPGGQVAGCFYLMPPGAAGVKGQTIGPVIIAEGWATAETLHAAVPQATVVTAFNAGNLLKVAQAMREFYPDSSIVIAGDNDHQREQEGKTNVGKLSALKAAAAMGGQVVIPQFKPGDTGTDWNDVAQYQGNEMVEQAMRESLAVAKRKMIVGVRDSMQEGGKIAEKNSMLSLHTQNGVSKHQKLTQHIKESRYPPFAQNAYLSGTDAQWRDKASIKGDEPKQKLVHPHQRGIHRRRSY